MSMFYAGNPLTVRVIHTRLALLWPERHTRALRYETK